MVGRIKGRLLSCSVPMECCKYICSDIYNGKKAYKPRHPPNQDDFSFTILHSTWQQSLTVTHIAQASQLQNIHTLLFPDQIPRLSKCISPRLPPFLVLFLLLLRPLPTGQLMLDRRIRSARLRVHLTHFRTTISRPTLLFSASLPAALLITVTAVLARPILSTVMLFLLRLLLPGMPKPLARRPRAMTYLA